MDFLLNVDQVTWEILSFFSVMMYVGVMATIASLLHLRSANLWLRCFGMLMCQNKKSYMS